MTRSSAVIGLFLSCVLATSAAAQSAPTVTLQSGFQAQSLQAEASGVHNVADSATLRARGCVGFVDTNPSLSISFTAPAGSDAAVTIRASSSTDLVLLIGTASNEWFCDDDSQGTDPVITLPPGSGSYSVWVGTRQKGKATATVSLAQTRVTPTSASTSSASASSTSPASTGGPCGSPSANIPQSIATEDWSRFSCMTQEAAGSSWSQCYGRASYSDERAHGCPGAELCCPYEGFNLAASQQRSRAAASTTTTQTSTPAASTPSSSTSTPAASASTQPRASSTTSTPAASTPSASATAAAGGTPPVGTVAAGAEDLLTVNGTPFGSRGGATVVYWRGFPNAQVPVRRETRSDAPVLFHLQGADFPRAADDSILVVTRARKLRARTATSLNTSDGSIAIAAGQEIDLIGPVSAAQCQLRIRDRIQLAACPSDAVFEGVGAPFVGLSPLAYDWWIAVEDDNRQRGWVHVDLSRPEFVVVLPPVQ